MLHLNNTKIKGSDLKVAATLSLAGEDISGQSSMTATAETGDKPKQLSISLLVKFNEAKNLTELLSLAEAKDEKSERETYTVVNDTAKAMNIRKVRFQGDLSVREDETLRLWRVSFKLTEIQSVAEAKESRQEKQPVQDQKPTGETVEPTQDAIPKAEELTDFEKVLSWVDSLGSEESGAA